MVISGIISTVSSETAGEAGALRFSPLAVGASMFGGGGTRFSGLSLVNKEIADDIILA